jgi:hypothetical protein
MHLPCAVEPSIAAEHATGRDLPCNASFSGPDTPLFYDEQNCFVIALLVRGGHF